MPWSEDQWDDVVTYPSTPVSQELPDQLEPGQASHQHLPFQENKLLVPRPAVQGFPAPLLKEHQPSDKLRGNAEVIHCEENNPQQMNGQACWAHEEDATAAPNIEVSSRGVSESSGLAGSQSYINGQSNGSTSRIKQDSQEVPETLTVSPQWDYHVDPGHQQPYKAASKLKSLKPKSFTKTTRTSTTSTTSTTSSMLSDPPLTASQLSEKNGVDGSSIESDTLDEGWVLMVDQQHPSKKPPAVSAGTSDSLFGNSGSSSQMSPSSLSNDVKKFTSANRLEKAAAAASLMLTTLSQSSPSSSTTTEKHPRRQQQQNQQQQQKQQQRPQQPQQQKSKVQQSQQEEKEYLYNHDSGAVSSGLYSEVGSVTQDGMFSKQFQLHEYEKPKTAPKKLSPARYKEIYHPFYYDYQDDYDQDDYDFIQGRARRRVRLPEEDEDSDRVNALLCLVFCVMGLGVVIALIVLLCHYVEAKEQEQKELEEGTACLDIMNIINQRRIADVIQLMAFNDNTKLGLSSENTSRTSIRHAMGSDNQGQEPLGLCDLPPAALLGNSTDVNLTISVDVDDIISSNSDVSEGGEWKPSSCISRHRVAVIIPYRDRWNHLKVLLHYLIPTLKRQQIHFRIFVVEQHGNETFNKGRIMNAAFREALKLFDFQCVTFHDVDLVPEDDRNMYSCTEQPKHMSISIDKFAYTLPYQGLVGGVLMFRTEHFQLVNGYSNMYWGWGAEDDDMTTRILHRGLRIYRPPSNIARYKMVKHKGRKTSEVAVRMKLLRSAARRSKMEGLNNVQYKLLFTHKERLFTHFMVDIGHP